MHPIDKMGWLKEQLDPLKREYEILRKMLLAGHCDPIGARFVADVRESHSREIDVRDAERILPADWLTALVRVKTTREIDVRDAERILPADWLAALVRVKTSRKVFIVPKPQMLLDYDPIND